MFNYSFFLLVRIYTVCTLIFYFIFFSFIIVYFNPLNLAVRNSIMGRHQVVRQNNYTDISINLPTLNGICPLIITNQIFHYDINVPLLNDLAESHHTKFNSNLNARSNPLVKKLLILFHTSWKLLADSKGNVL